MKVLLSYMDITTFTNKTTFGKMHLLL